MKSVVICGSSRFAKEIREFAKKLRDFGVIVYEPIYYFDSDRSWEDVTDFDKPLIASGLTYGHFHKINLADVVYVFNKDGYSGFGTTLEIGYAVAMNKPIYAFSGDDEEIFRKVLFSGIVSDPKDLLNYLQ